MVTLNTLETSWGQKNFKNSKKFQIFGKILKIQKNFKFLEKFQKLTICGENIKKKLFLHKIFTFFLLYLLVSDFVDHFLKKFRFGPF